MQKIKKACKFLLSMRFAIILLTALLAICFVGSFLPQNEPASYYTSAYPEKLGLLITLVGFDDTFHSPLFIFVSALLCLNLLGCNVIHFPALIRNWKTGLTPSSMLKYAEAKNSPVAAATEPSELFRSAHFTKHIEGTSVDGQRYLYSVRNKIGLTGAWLTHLGLLVVIAGFTLGQVFAATYTVYGVPGDTRPIEGTQYLLTIDSFDIGLREDETVTQYTSKLTMTDPDTGKTQSGTVSVNHPLTLFGMKLYQNSTGWASNIIVFKGDEFIQSQVVCAGDSIAIKDFEDLVIVFHAFYPDFVYSAGRPATKSSSLNNPGYLYSAYYEGDMIGMNILLDNDYITIDDYSVFFEEPQNYTLIQLKRDPFTFVTLIGGIIMCFALIFAFYTNTEEIMAIEEKNGTWSIHTRSKKNELLLNERIHDIIT